MVRKYKDKDGYILIRKPDSFRYVGEHRLVYEESRNCCLLSWTDIHHMDGNRQNNIWYNLQPLDHKRHNIIDMSDRICAACGSNKTELNTTNNRQRWCFLNNKLVCRKCYDKRRRETPKRKAYLREYLRVYRTKPHNPSVLQTPQPPL